MNPSVVCSFAQHFKDRQPQIIGAWIRAVKNDPEISSARRLSDA
jgi:hypothetical protein